MYPKPGFMRSGSIMKNHRILKDGSPGARAIIQAGLVDKQCNNAGINYSSDYRLFVGLVAG